MQEIPNDLNDEVLLELWLRFGLEYEQLGYRRKSYELFAKYLMGEFPQLRLGAEEIKRRVRACNKRRRGQRKSGS